MDGIRVKSEFSGFSRYIKPVVFGGLIGVFATAVMLAIFALCYSSLDISSTWVYWLSIFALIVGGFISGLISAKIVGQKGVVVGVLSGIFLSLIFLALSVSIGSLSSGMITKLIVIFVSSVLGGVIGVNSR